MSTVCLKCGRTEEKVPSRQYCRAGSDLHHGHGHAWQVVVLLTYEERTRVDKALARYSEGEPSAIQPSRDLIVLDEQIRSLRAQLDVLEEERHLLAANVVLRCLVPFGFPDDRDPSDLHEGNRSCPTSPTGRCFYDDYEDPASDDCLFCHGPAERK